MTIAELRALAPEWDGAPDDVVQGAIDAAEATIDSTWGAHLERGLVVLASRKLARSPFARDMRLVSREGVTVYDAEWFELCAIHGSGGSVV